MKYVFRNERCEVEWLAVQVAKVDDSRDIACLKALLLQRHGYEFARDAIRAWRYYNTFRNALWTEMKSRQLIAACLDTPEYPFHYGDYLAMVEEELGRMNKRDRCLVTFVSQVFALAQCIRMSRFPFYVEETEL